MSDSGDVKHFAAPVAVRGTVRVPGDKSISHRALLLAGVATGKSRIGGLGPGADVAATAHCLRQLGVAIRGAAPTVTVDSPGWGAWQSPRGVLECGNSGTTMRLLLGLLAARPGLVATLDGDASLRQRPMARVVAPLQDMGADIGSSGGRPPLFVRGRHLAGAAHTLAVASAQVKSALLLAGLFADGETSIAAPQPTRDHTERLLARQGVGCSEEHGVLRIRGAGVGADLPPLGAYQVPGDPSSAAFPIVLALLHPAARIAVASVALSPRRLGFVRVLQRMGAQLRVEAGATRENEPTGRLLAASSALIATAVTAAEIPDCIDELPLLCLAAAAAHGTTRFAGLAELRVKESDRLAATARLLADLGVASDVGEDWLCVHGVGRAQAWQPGAAPFAPGLDHRMAMTAAVASSVQARALGIRGFDAAVASSWPGFAAALGSLGVSELP